MKLTINGKKYRRIQEKPDGKNNSNYDGTYAPKEMRCALKDRGSEIYENPSSYPTGLVFVKKCPVGDMLVEGFAEGLAGEIINQCIIQGFIPDYRADCFSPATLFTLPDNTLALVQAYATGYKPLYTLVNERQKAKSVTTEMLRKHILRMRYDYLAEGNVEQHGLSYAMMVMITLLGNYSLHSGNVFVKKVQHQSAEKAESRPVSGGSIESLDDEWLELHYKIIDYGASYRAMHLTPTFPDIFTSPEEGLKAFNMHKRYANQYKNMPNLFETVAAHAKDFRGDLLSTLERQAQFNTLIAEAVKKTIATFKSQHEQFSESSPVKADWRTVLSDLMEYTIGTKGMPLLNDERNIELLAESLFGVINDRIVRMAEWRRSMKISNDHRIYHSPLKNPALTATLPENAAFYYFVESLDVQMRRFSEKAILDDKAKVVKIIQRMVDILDDSADSVLTLMHLLKNIANVNQGVGINKNAFTNALAVLMIHTGWTSSDEINTANFQAIANYCQHAIETMMPKLSPRDKSKISSYKGAINLLTEIDFSRNNFSHNAHKYGALDSYKAQLKTPAREILVQERSSGSSILTSKERVLKTLSERLQSTGSSEPLSASTIISPRKLCFSEDVKENPIGSPARKSTIAFSDGSAPSSPGVNNPMSAWLSPQADRRRPVGGRFNLLEQIEQPMEKPS